MDNAFRLYDGRTVSGELGWPEHAGGGTTRGYEQPIANNDSRGLEIGQFAIPDAEGRIDACTRRLPTRGRYLLGEAFVDLIDAAPRDARTWENTHFYADHTCAHTLTRKVPLSATCTN